MKYKSITTDRRTIDEAYYREVKLQQLRLMAESRGVEQVTYDNIHNYLPLSPGRHKTYALKVGDAVYYGYTGDVISKRLAFHVVDSRSKHTTLYRTWRGYQAKHPDWQPQLEVLMTFKNPIDALLYEVKMIDQGRRRGIRVLNDSAGGEGPTFHVRNRALPRDVLRHFKSMSYFRGLMNIEEPFVTELPLISNDHSKLVHTTKIEDDMMRHVGFTRLQCLQYYRNTKNKVRRRLRRAWQNKKFNVLLSFFDKAKRNNLITIK